MTNRTKSRLRSITTDRPFLAAVHPQDLIGPFLPISMHDVETFNDLLSDEIDSRFSSSLCCCDYCYDDFCEHWPHVPFRENDFQTQSMDSIWMVEYSRLPEIYTPAEISTLRHLVICPRCSAQGPANVWVYEHRFSDVPDIENSIDELLDLAERTPFLLLEHEFSQRVLSTLRAISQQVNSTTLQAPLYRARLVDSAIELKQSPSDLMTYGAPPPAVVGEGRYNHAGRPMLYLADSSATAIAEISSDQPCYVGKLRLLQPLRILDLVNVDDAHPGQELLEALAHSALLSAPSTGKGWVKKQYIFSRFVADCAIAANFDAIRYGSTKSREGSNYVLLKVPDDLSAHATLEAYEDMGLAADCQTVTPF